MADNKKLAGKPDRGRVAANQPHEVGYLARKHGLPAPLVKNVINQEGPLRRNVEGYLRGMKKK